MIRRWKMLSLKFFWFMLNRSGLGCGWLGLLLLFYYTCLNISISMLYKQFFISHVWNIKFQSNHFIHLSIPHWDCFDNDYRLVFSLLFSIVLLCLNCARSSAPSYYCQQLAVRTRCFIRLHLCRQQLQALICFFA